MNDLSERSRFAITTALAAGELLQEGFGTRFEVQKKEGIHNLVTEYDLKSEDKILSSLQQAFPLDGMVSEERGGDISSKKEVVWVIDPLDGTVNFAHEIPFFCVSIAAIQQGKPLLGVVYQPMSRELFVAEKGKGAFCNNKKIEISATKSLSHSFLATGFPYNFRENPHACMDRFMNVLQEGIPLRRLGSAALDLAYLASGRFDGFWEVGLKAWDCAAGILLVQEAGGKVSDFKGKIWQLMEEGPIVASNGKIHEELVSLLQKVKK